jgi:phosphate transport system permease protein
MHAPAKSADFRQHARTRGEVYVWISSMGLVAGLVMVLFLLGLILVNGVNVFWPKPVAVLALKPAASAALGDAPAIAGEIIKKQVKRGLPADAPRQEEYQLYTANRDAYGASYKYIDADQVESISYPKDLIIIERKEYGDAIGAPVSIVTADGQTTPYGDPAFATLLDRLAHDSSARRAEIQRIEKSRIGAINAKMTALRVRQRSIQRSGKDRPAEIARIQAQLESLQADYEKLAASARELRDQQALDSFNLRLASGQERSIVFGNIVHFYYPNQLRLPDKVKLFVHGFWAFLSQDPREANTEGGIFPAIFGTFVMTLLMSIAVMPFGVVAAIYLREYATQGIFVRSVRIAVNNLAGVPSIVFGVFGLGFFVYFVGGSIDRVFFPDTLPTPTFGTGGIMWAALTLALMTVPVVIVATEEALAAVPRGVREGSLACGASKWQTIQRIVLPAAAPGILTGLILAMARGAGEVAPLMLVGVVKLAPSLPLDGEFPFVHLERKFMHLGFHIYDLGFQSPDSEAAKPMVFATTLLLILLVVILNFAAIIIRERLRKKYAAGTF